MIRSFKDTEGREWLLRVDVDAVRRLRANGIDFQKLVKNNLADLKEDFELLGNFLFVLCQEQAEKRKLTDSEFGRALAGDVILHATDALVEAIIDFFPNSEARQAIRRAESLGKQIQAEMYGGMIKRVEEVTPDQVKTLAAQLLKRLGSSESTPESGPSES